MPTEATVDWSAVYAEAKTWQTGLAALLGFLGLVTAALFNFFLNRRRDDRLRREEARAVAAALYSEVLLLRALIAALGERVATKWVREQTFAAFDKEFLTTNRLPEPVYYSALAAKIGMLPPGVVSAITAFYRQYFETQKWLPYLEPDDMRGFFYNVTFVLTPACAAVNGIGLGLRQLEQFIPVELPAQDISMATAEDVIAHEEQSAQK